MSGQQLSTTRFTFVCVAFVFVLLDDLDTDNSRASNSSCKESTKNSTKPTTSDITTTTPRPSRQAKTQAIEKMRNFGKGCNNLDSEDGKFKGVSYGSRGKSKTS